MALESPHGILDRLESLERSTIRIESKIDKLLEYLRVRQKDHDGTDKHDSDYTNDPRNSSSSIQTYAQLVAPIKDDPYPYRPLDPDEGEIRILILYPGKHRDDPIMGRLDHQALGNNVLKILPPHASLYVDVGPKPTKDQGFSALSYTWESSEKASSVILDGHHFSVTKNLEAALRCIRKYNKLGLDTERTHGSEEAWWIDAICINQGNIEERNQQVTMMRRIFKRAEKVDVWLGEESDDSNLAMNLIHRLNRYSRKGPGEFVLQYPELTSSQKALNLKALENLFRRSWWERSWVRQEIILGRDPAVRCGDLICSFDDVIAAAKVLRYLEDQLGSSLKTLESDDSDAAPDVLPKLSYDQALFLDELIRGTYYGEDFVRLEDLLIHTRTCKATDLRDKVFSVLGLADPDVYKIKVDYGILPRDLFVDTVRVVVSATKSLDILSRCQDMARTDGLPSWVPNFGLPWTLKPLSSGWVSDSMPEEFDGRTQFSFHDGGSILRVKGAVIDSIERLSDDFVRREDTDETLHSLYRKWNDFAARPTADQGAQHFFPWGRRGLPRKKILDSVAKYSVVQGVEEPMNVQLVKTMFVPDGLVNEGTEEDQIPLKLRRACFGRRFCYTKRKFFFHVPAGTRIGDLICALWGASYPCILRNYRSGYKLVGSALPESDLLYQLERWKPKDEEFSLL